MNNHSITSWPLILLLIAVFAGFVPVIGGPFASLMLMGLVAMGFVLAQIIPSPQIGLYLAVFFFMLDSRSLPFPGPFSLSASNLLLISTLAALLLGRLDHRGREKNVRLANIDKTSLLLGSGLIFAAFLSSFVASYPEIVLRLIVTLIGNLIVLFAVQALVNSAVEVERLFKVYIASATVCASLGIVQALLARFVGIEYGVMYWALGGGLMLDVPRVASTWLDPNIYGMFLVPAVVFIWGANLRNWMRFSLMGILLAGLAISFSRTTWISVSAAIAGTVVLYWLTRRVNKPLRSQLGLRVVFLVLAGSALVVAVPWQEIWDMLVSLNPDAFEGRVEMTLIGMRHFYDSPILGIGPGNLYPVSMAFTHNSYASVLVEYGLIGALAWFSLLILTGWRGMKVVIRCNRSDLWRLTTVSVGAFTGVLIGGLSVEIQNDKFVWLVIAIVTVLFRQFLCVVRPSIGQSEEGT